MGVALGSKAIGGGMFDYWTVLGGARAEIIVRMREHSEDRLRFLCGGSAGDGERREVTGEFAQTLFGSVSGAIPGLLGGIGLSALVSTCGTGLLILGIIVAIARGRRGMQVVTPQSYVAGADLNSILAAKARQMPVSTAVSSAKSGGDLTARLEQLKAAFDKKLISQEEYDRLRKAILDDMK